MSQATIKTLSELRRYAHDLAGTLKGGDVVALVGELGVGKTALTQMMAKALGVHRAILSPTFTVFKIYPVKRRPYTYVCHADLYRVDAAERLGFEEYLGNEDGICIIEWGEKIKSQLPKNTVWLSLKTGSDGSRIISRAG